MRMPEGISDTDFLLLEVLWQKGKKQFFIVIPFICEYNSIGELKNID